MVTCAMPKDIRYTFFVRKTDHEFSYSLIRVCTPTWGGRVVGGRGPGGGRGGGTIPAIDIGTCLYDKTNAQRGQTAKTREEQLQN